MRRRIILTVTNDLTYDQRMHRICGTLAQHNYAVILVGRRLKTSPPLPLLNYKQVRLKCWFNKGKWFYREYNIRLFIFMLFKKMDAVCSIDLDTILAGLYVSKLKRIARIYDAHELFTELKEVISRPAILRTWMSIEKKCVPRFKYGYTVSEGIAGEFKKRYGVHYETIRNVPLLKELPPLDTSEKFILYQGAVNEARGFEWLVPAMKHVACGLVVCGDGNFMPQLRKLVEQYGMQDKIILKGSVSPDELWNISTKAYAGIAIAESDGLNQWLALPNKFFDYIHAGLPQVTMDFPEYRKINDHYQVALLIPELSVPLIADALNKLINDDVLHQRLRQNCIRARQELNWQSEEQKLIAFYRTVLEN